MGIHVIGGAYKEYCTWPSYTSLQGSAGRAALCLTQIDSSLPITLHSRLAQKDENELRALFFGNANVSLSLDNCDETVSFDYFHPLAEPKILPSPINENLSGFTPNLPASAVAVVFGMIDATPIVSASTVIYDPQNTYDPLLFSETGGIAEKLVYITNQNEIKIFGEKKGVSHTSVEDMAKWLHSTESAEVVIVKCGQRGAYVYSTNESGWALPYETDSVSPVGSGDSFVAAYTYYWHILGCSALKAAEKASVAAAHYVSTGVMNNVQGLEVFQQSLTPVKASKKKVYLAGPFFTLSELWMINEAKYYIESFGMETFSPFHEIGIGTADEVVQKDIDAIKDCDVMYAIFNGTDPGTLFEIGYAISLNKPVIILAENPKAEELKMYDGSGCKIFGDFSSSIYRLSWV
ncbi:PfkB family carbohydrate kinase [Kangiella sp. TOML190]|uniref:PfkB family carbohydrate kinase n=1 Tax=Kangiella sp. TOML190 TaxID=2931351 RepID=UPI00203DEF91|nr:PfkB family carbohydrate kinase [Kangiella sp. TOML190]